MGREDSLRKASLILILDYGIRGETKDSVKNFLV